MSDKRDVVVAISAFRSDEAVLDLLGKLFGAGDPGLAGCIVVDSQGSGQIGAAIAERGWPVTYIDADTNLGSAGNLHRRLTIAAAIEGARWCLALNHDGMFTFDYLSTMLRCAREGGDRVGAVYPRRILFERDVVIEPHRSHFGLPRYRRASARTAAGEVAWDSSNGALYSLDAVRAGLTPWPDLWLGWEDMAFGWLLAHHDWRQLYCEEATFLDDYESETARLFGRDFTIARKPSWYNYLLVRNLFIIARRTGEPAAYRLLATRLLREAAMTTALRSDKKARLGHLWRGLVDGARGVTGMGRTFTR